MPQHIDAAYVLWATCKLVDLEKVPSKGLAVRIDLADRPKDRFWLLLRQSHAEVCSSYPGRAEDLIVRTDSQTLAHWHLRHVTYEEAARSGRLRIEGARASSRAFLACIRPSPFAGIQPPRSPPPPAARNDHRRPSRHQATTRHIRPGQPTYAGHPAAM
jgi:hypothetical protein